MSAEQKLSEEMRQVLKTYGLDKLSTEDQRIANVIVKDAQIAYHAYYGQFGYVLFSPHQPPKAGITGTNTVGNLRAIFESLLENDLRFGPLNAYLRKRAGSIQGATD